MAQSVVMPSKAGAHVVASAAARGRRKQRQKKVLLTEDDKRRKAVIRDAESHIVTAGLQTLGRVEVKILMEHLTGHEPSEPSDAVIDMLMAKAACPSSLIIAECAHYDHRAARRPHL